MKQLFFCLALLAPAIVFAQSDTVHHPAPKEPTLISANLYDKFKSQLQAPPSLQSAAQKNDEKTLFALQKSRTPKDCAQAGKEVFVSLESFYGQPHGPLAPADIKKLSQFFNHVRNDGDFFIQKLKVDFPRQRPFAYIEGIEPCVPKEVTGAYPSGHAALSKLYALILSDLYPADKAALETRAAEIGKHRVLSGMHHPTDVENGRKLAELVYGELQKSPAYRSVFKEAAQQVQPKL